MRYFTQPVCVFEKVCLLAAAWGSEKVLPTTPIYKALIHALRIRPNRSAMIARIIRICTYPEPFQTKKPKTQPTTSSTAII